MAVAFVETDGLLLIEVQAAPDAPDDLARVATGVAVEHSGGTVAVEVVRWGDGGPHVPEARFRLVEVGTDLTAGTLLVRLARGDEESVGRAPTEHGLLSAVEATVYAVRAFLPAAHLPPGLGPPDRDPARSPLPRGRVGDRSRAARQPARRRRGLHADRSGGARPRSAR